MGKQLWFEPVRLAILAAVIALPAMVSLAQEPPVTVDPAEKKLFGAEGLLARGQYDMAAQEFSEFLKIYPRDARVTRARYGRALAAQGLNDLATASAMLETVVTDKAFGKREEALAILGAVQLSQNAPERALAALETLLKEYPKGAQAPTAVINRAQALNRLGKYAESIQALDAFIKANPQSPLRASALYLLALNQRAIHDDASATATLKQITAEFPNAPFFYQAQLQLGESLAAQGHLDDALAHYRKLETESPESAKPAVIFSLGTTLASAGKYPEAQQTFERLAATYRNSAFAGAAKLQSAAVLVHSEKLDRAREALAAVAREAPAQANAAAYWLARCDLLDGKYAAAREAMQKLAPLKTAELPDIQFDLAYCDLMLGADDAAIKKLEAFRASYPHSPHIPEALAYEARALHRLGDLERSTQFCEAVIGDGTSLQKSAVARQAALLKSENLLLLGQHEKADTLLATLEKTPGPESTQEQLRVNFRRGQAAYAGGDYKAAETRLAEVVKNPAVEKDATLREALFFLGDSRLKRDAFDAAVESFKAYLSAPKVDLRDEASYKLALAQAGTKDLPAAMATLQDLTNGDNKSVWVQRAFLKLAEFQVQQGELAKARETIKPVLAGKVDESVAAPANYVMATQIEMAKEPAQAADRLAALVKKFPKHPLAEEATYVRGLCLLAAKQPVDAQKQFAAYMAAYPTGKYAADAKHQSAVAMTAQGRSTDAIKTLTEMASRRETRNDSIVYDLARAYLAASDKKHAEETYRTVLSEYPAGMVARVVRLELPDLLYGEQQYPQAAELLTIAASDKAATPQQRETATYRLGHCYSRLGQYDKAASTFDAFVQMAPNEARVPDAVTEAGTAYAALGNIEQAKKRLDRVLSDFADSPAAVVALVRLGETQNQNSEYDASGVTFAKWLKQNGKHPLAPLAEFGLGWSLENRRKFAEARDAYKRATEADNGPVAARAQFQIGETFFGEGQFELAAKELVLVDVNYAATSPQWCAAALYDAGRAFEQLKQPDRAKQQYRDCINKYKNSDFAAMAKKKIEALGG